MDNKEGEEMAGEEGGISEKEKSSKDSVSRKMGC